MPEGTPETADNQTRATEPGKSEADALSERDVIAYLRKHIDLLRRRPELLRDILPPERQHGENVVDLQTVMIEQLRNEREELISTSRVNLMGQSRVHQAVLKLLDARGLEQFAETLATDLPIILDIEAITLCVECAPANRPAQTFGNIRVIDQGETEKIFGKLDVRLDPDIQGEARLFGPVYALVRSQALVRLEFGSSGPIGFLALGAREENTFDPHQGTELLIFLARAIERCVTLWLEP